MRQLFERKLRGQGAAAGGFGHEHLTELRGIVGRIPYRAGDEPANLVLDEAWLPVHTPDGPGVLVWRNSD